MSGSVWGGWVHAKSTAVQMYPGWSARDNYAIHKKRRKRKVKQVDSKGEDGSMEEEKNKDGESCYQEYYRVFICLHIL